MTDIKLYSSITSSDILLLHTTLSNWERLMHFLAFFIEFNENLIDLRVLAIFCLTDKLSLSHAPPPLVHKLN